MLNLYLKRLDIQGFKSFADKISLDFNKGITSVVGPNGSGKSNIADAVRWVLGEQSIKSLRGSKMEDIIFAGTEHRKPLGFAEVSLTIDNSEGTLPVDFAEVTITRRVFRSGESEFFINKTPCRLKDIYELFLDTGIGRDGYSIIGQGKVDEILSNRAEDRRVIFEEASGIMKYKVRKQEAERKLEQTSQNLLRISDIINELESQLEPLRQQAETARKFLDLRERLKELEVNVYLENLSRYREKLKELEDQYKTIKDDIDRENLKLEKITEENSRKTERLKQIKEMLEAKKQEYFNLEGNTERYNSEIKLNDEKINNYLQNISRVENEIAEISQKVEHLTDEENARKNRILYLNKKYDEYSKKLAEYEKELQEIMESLNESERHIENLKISIMSKMDILSDKRVQIGNVKSHKDNLIKRMDSISREINSIYLEVDRENIKKEDLSESIRKAREAILQSQRINGELTAQKEREEAELADKRKRQNALRADIQFKSSRYKMLQDMEKNLEGYNRSVRQILQACRHSSEFGKGIHGALAQLITVDRKYETAVEMSLGGALQNIVTTTEEDAKKAIEYLKKNMLGRATFLPISSVKGKYLDESLVREIRKQEGFCGVASDLVSFNPEYKGIILSLLGKVVIVENLDAGIKMARKFDYGFRIVTLDGDVLSTTGSLSGGSKESKGSGILSRNREITELKEEIEKLNADLVQLEKEINGIIEKVNSLSACISKEQEKIRNNELIITRDESHLAQVVENVRRYEAKIEMLKQEREQLSRQEAETARELEKYEKEAAEIEEDIEKTKRIVSEHQEKHKEVQIQRDNLHTEITNFKISVNSIVESLENVKEALNRITGEKEASKRSIAKKDAEKARSNEEINALKERNEGLKQLIKNNEIAKTSKSLEIDSLTEESEALDEETSSIVNQITEINRNILLLKEEFNRVEVRKIKIESEMEAIQNRMWDEYELTYTNALELKKDIGNIKQAQRKIDEYRNEIKELGPVNVAAIEEYIKTKERYDFMLKQKNDMEQAEEKLRKVIQEMVSIMKRQFIEQFRLINEYFNDVFRELFEGGRAELILVDKENVLESGIEIEVQPPGKKLQNMMLLSGGERAFTAIALLFAILRLRPAPFCILDEIEAALDDANVYRFAEYIKKYSSNTQFVIITHRKGTMEVSDTLYGVTMQERGISKVVSMRMNEKVS